MNHRFLFLLPLLAILVAPPASAADPAGPIAEALGKAVVTQYAKAPGYSEGPAWVDGEVFFCSGALLKVAKDRTVTRYLDIGPAGTFLKADGRLLICDNKHKALLEMSREGRLAVIADEFDGQPLNSLNDVTVDAAGNVYWTDPSGSSVQKPVGSVFRVTPEGKVARVATGLAFPNGLDVDPTGKWLYVIESQTKKILRYAIPKRDEPLGELSQFYDLGGSGGDGCAFDAQGNLWSTDYHRPETNRGRIAVLSTDETLKPEQRLLGTLDIPAKVVSNITFGGPERDEIFCTTGDPPGVFHSKVGVKGFAGHPGKPLNARRTLDVKPENVKLDL